jgi:hypothetical protein
MATVPATRITACGGQLPDVKSWSRFSAEGYHVLRMRTFQLEMSR